MIFSLLTHRGGSGSFARLLTVIAFALLLAFTLKSPAVPAFPGAEGCGANAVGGRGGSVYYVTNLNDTGAGSLRNGITSASGPRTILFKVSGTIELASDLSINKPNLTIAGQTAPGDGITLKRRTTSVSGTHDVIVRYLRCRPGDADTNFQSDAVWVVNATNTILDHVSTSWSVDECLSVTWSTNVTIQWCLISESLNNSQHDKGKHGYGSLLRYAAGNLTFHHNLYQHHNSRNPRLGDRIKLDFINNVIYNWGGTAGYSGGSADLADNPGGFTNYLNYVGNYLVAGPSSTSPNTAFASGATNTVIYQADNRIDPNKNAVLDGTDTGWGMFNGYPYTLAANRYPLPEVATNSAATAYQRVLAFAGASSVRDAVDLRLIGTVNNQTGRLVDAVGPADQAADYVTNNINGTNYIFVRGWPALASTVAPTDTDNDGIPDYWERALNWNPAVANNNHTNSDGYTDLEWYLNWLADPHALGGADQTLNVNLRQLTGGATNLAYTAANGTNGTVALSADGYTAQFLPAANFKGLAGFAFAATNALDGAGFGPVTVAVLVTNVAPVILTQPSSTTNQPGDTVVFSVTARGADLSWRWRKNGSNLSNGGNVSGATNALLTLAAITAADAANYTVVITNSMGSVTSSIAALVIVSNTPPSLDPIANRWIIAGTNLTFPTHATDSDLPAQTLTFSLLNAPAGASIGTNTGAFSWRPTMAQGGTTNGLSVVVADSGVPSLSATQSFTVTVNRPAQPSLQQPGFTGGRFSLNIGGDLGPDYTIQASTNLVSWTNVFTTNPPALPFNWSDPAAGSFSQRFYRVLLGP